MPTRVVLKTPGITVWHHPELRIVHHEMARLMSGEEFRSALMAGVEIFKKHGPQKWLSDDRKCPSMPAADFKWAQDVWSPQVRSLGWKTWGIVVANVAESRFTMTRVGLIGGSQGLEIGIFDGFHEAWEWLVGRQ